MLKEKLQQDLKTVLKQRKELEVSVLRMGLASIVNREKEKRYKLAKENPEWGEQELQEKSQLTDEEVIEVLTWEARKRKEAITEFKKGNRQDLVQKEQKELEIIQQYLPEQLSELEIRKLAQQTIEQLGVESTKDMGRVIGQLMSKLKGRADGGTVNKIVKELLTNV